MKTWVFRPWTVLLAGTLLAGVGIIGVSATPAGAQASCTPAGSSGLTAAVVATQGQTVTGTIDATGCDIGVYVGPGITGVRIAGATISGAGDHGILVQDTSGVAIADDVVSGNGLAPHLCPPPPTPPSGPCIPEDKAIALVGTSYSTVLDNAVVGNKADGGIAITDDGTPGPGTLNPGTPSPATGNLVFGNRVVGNAGGCGIVLASYVAGEGASRNVVAGNVVAGNPAGIIVAADLPGTAAQGNWVVRNTVADNFLPGIILHANAPGDVVLATVVAGNTIYRNGPDPSAAGGHGPTKPTGVIVVGEVTAITGTLVADNPINHEHFGVWIANAKGTAIREWHLDHATVPVFVR